MSSPSQPVMASRTDHVKKSLPTVAPPPLITTAFLPSVLGKQHQIDSESETAPVAEDRHCRYTAGVWSSCNAHTRSRTRERTLQAGSSELCDQRMVETKPCFTRSGKGNTNSLYL